MFEPSDEDVNVWRRFRSGETAHQISQTFDDVGDVGRATVLRIVLLVESEMATSTLFFEERFDAEGCPDSIKKEQVFAPRQNDALEKWLRERG